MKLDYDEIVIFEPKKTLITKILYIFLIFFLTIVFGISLCFLIVTNQLEHIILVFFPILFIYVFIYILNFKIVLTNKRILYQNIFFRSKSIWLKNIIDIDIDNLALHSSGLSFLFDLQNIKTLEFKVLKKSFKTRIFVPEVEEFRETTLNYIYNNLKENSLSEDLIENELI